MKNLLPDDCLKLGFGLMRLPRTTGGNATGPIDIEKSKKMVDDFIAAGGRYFDTAYVYEGSEEAIREALVSRYPRESYFLATKLNAGAWAAKTEEDAKAEFQKSLQRTGAGYFDFYLLHSIDAVKLPRYDSFGIWDYVKGLQQQGLIRHWGFSFHSKPDLLDRILTEHPDTEFVQLQINYADWEDTGVMSRENYEVCVKHDVPVVVMEPVKGGMLAEPPAKVAELFKAAAPEASFPSWAIRFAASLPQVMVVLSGMSSPEQMAGNLSYMRDFKPLSPEENATIEKVREALQSIDSIGCTGCHYCSPGCPVGMHIPEIFSVMNIYRMYGDMERARADYSWRPGGPKASSCIQCGQCEDACPQHLQIISLLEEASQKLE